MTVINKLDVSRSAMSALFRAPEEEVLAKLLPAATLDAAARERVASRARDRKSVV